MKSYRYLRTAMVALLVGLGGLGADFATTVRACENAAGPLLTQTAATDLDCPTVRALVEAGRANVENNTVSLLVVGGLGLLATVLFALKDSRSSDPAARRRSRLQLWWGLGAAFAVWAASGFVLWRDTGWFIGNAHYLAAVGLFGYLFVVVLLFVVLWMVQTVERMGDETAGGVVAEQ